jgi:hypothetical protein
MADNKTGRQTKMTRTQYIASEKQEAGEFWRSTMEDPTSNEYYNNYIAKHQITLSQYNDLTEGQKFHYNKHYNHRGDMIV